jgi:cytochrome b pre-mRNA-processing protein 3
MKALLKAGWFRGARRARTQLAAQIADETTQASRREELFTRLGVADTLEGRFEMVALHAGLVMRRLSALGVDGSDLAQVYVDQIFTGFDDALREMAIGDVGVLKRMRRYVEAFYGRLTAYDSALQSSEPEPLIEALARNVYGKTSIEDAAYALALAEYAQDIVRALQAVTFDDFANGRFVFPLGQFAERT